MNCNCPACPRIARHDTWCSHCVSAGCGDATSTAAGHLPAVQKCEPIDAPLEPTGKATVYMIGGMGMGYLRIEVKTVTVDRVQYAQYDSAVRLRWRQPRKRKDGGTMQTAYPSAIILEGWGHFNQADAFTAPKEDTVTGVMVSTMRHTMFSNEWRTEFDECLRMYINDNPDTVVLRDYRNANPNER